MIHLALLSLGDSDADSPFPTGGRELGFIVVHSFSIPQGMLCVLGTVEAARVARGRSESRMRVAVLLLVLKIA